MLLDISDNIEAVANKAAHSSHIEQNLDFVDEHQPEHQKLVLRKIMGDRFQRNAFFRFAEPTFVIQILKNSNMKHIKAGEFIYSLGQAPNFGNLHV